MNRVAVTGVAIAGALALATAIIGGLEATTGIDDASPVFLIAVVLVGAAFGTMPALATAVVAFVVYDLLFTSPRFSLTVDDPREWLDLLLFLFVALAVGRLVAIQHRRAEEAERRRAEADALFALSHLLVTAESTEDAVEGIARRLSDEARLDRTWIALGPTGAEKIVADTSRSDPVPAAAIVTTLSRRPGSEPARWVRTHAQEGRRGRHGDSQRFEQLRVRIETDGVVHGSLAAMRDRTLGLPAREETRVLSLAADQIAISLRRDQVRRIATDLEVSRQGDALKTALIDAVSHDLRTPLASIRATAGGLADPDVAWSDEARREAATVIDAEAARLDRLVRGILDLGRIEAGALHPELEPYDLRSLVEPVLTRMRPSLGDRRVELEVSETLPPVTVDSMLFDVVLTNLVENAAHHAPPPSTIRIRAEGAESGRLRLVVEDGGPGVPASEQDRIFDRFHRVRGSHSGARRGLGIGLSVVKGLIDAMGGSVSASPSPLGGLAITLELDTATEPPEVAS